tara:strand:- start:141 stop:254 length:114 start_codon:yes stop_codon:yes gene_type:complete
MTSFEFAHNESLSFEPFKIKEEDLKKNVIKKEKPAYD